MEASEPLVSLRLKVCQPLEKNDTEGQRKELTV